uniref:Uncharacterized protein n=1 Tax=Panagrolaimus davidi TaxID=227884 RepID=A0A914PFG1_9BILA
MDEPHLLVLNCLVEELGNVFYGCEEVVEEKTRKTIPTANLELCFAVVEIFDAILYGEQPRINCAIENLKRVSKKCPKSCLLNFQVMTDRIEPILANGK